MTDASPPPPPPFGLSSKAWVNVDAVLKFIGILPIFAAAVLYILDYPKREEAAIAEAWRVLNARPVAPDKKRASNWGAVAAIEALVDRGQLLHSLDLPGADLSRARLKGADLSWSNLQGATLYGANLSKASLRCSDLRAANLREADLSGLDLSGSNVAGAVFSHDKKNSRDLQRILKTVCKDPKEEMFGLIINHAKDAPKVDWGTIKPCDGANEAIPLVKSVCRPDPE